VLLNARSPQSNLRRDEDESESPEPGPKYPRHNVGHLRLAWKNRVDRRFMFEFSPVCLSVPICFAIAKVRFPGLRKLGMTQVSGPVIPSLLSVHSAQFLPRCGESSQTCAQNLRCGPGVIANQ
jgi:hypothetical protein